MKTYYTKKGEVIGRAWGLMNCLEIADHKSHVHNPEYAVYGPYLCAGRPEIKVYDSKDRKPLNRVMKRVE